MKAKLSRHIFLWVLILVLLSCTFNLPLAGKTPSPTTAVGVPTPIATEAPAPPLSWFDLYQENVQSGTWTEGQGLVKMLGYFIGEVPAAEVIGDRNVMADNGDMLMAVAEQYVAAHPDAPDIAEIERLMNMLIPDGDKLLPYAEEIKELSMSAGKLAAPRAIPPEDQVACNDLWVGGFPPPTSGTPPICFDYLSFPAVGTQFRIFIERNWLGQDHERRSQLPELARDGLIRAATYYTRFATNGLLPTDVIFNQLNFSGSGIGATDPLTPMSTRVYWGQKCNIGIFPPSFLYPDPWFSQDVAHEMFHCFQGNNIVSFENVGNNFGKIKWWIEGTAEYFANVVYPDANEEHNLNNLGNLTRRVNTSSVFHMDYDNFLFFQHMGNYFGDTSVIITLHSLPISGDDRAFASALNDSFIRDPNEFYQLFGQGYLDISIPDTGITVAPLNPQPGFPYNMADVDIYQDSVQPYRLQWVQLQFPEKYKYTLDITAGTEGRYSAQRKPLIGQWGDLPTVIDTSCGYQEYTVLMTNTTPDANFGLEVKVDRTRKETCVTPTPGPCLPGTWELIPESLDPYMRSIISQVARFNSATVDSLTVTFDPGAGLVTYNWVNAVVDETKVGLSSENAQGGISPDTQMVMKLNGSTTSPYQDAQSTPGKGTITYGPAEGKLTVNLSLNGINRGNSSYNAEDLNWTFPSQATYECSENTLTLTPVMPPIQVEPLRFRRVAPR